MNGAASEEPVHPMFHTFEEDGYRAPAPPPGAALHSATATAPTASYGAGYTSANHDLPYAANGHAVAPRPPKQRGRFGAFWAAYKTPNQLMFLSLIVFQAIVVLAMIALVYATINFGTGDRVTQQITNNPKLESIATYLGLFILAELFEILVALDALQQKNIIQASLLIPFQCAMLVYSAVLPGQLRAGLVDTTADTLAIQRNVRAYAIVIPATIGAVTLSLAWLAYRLYEEFGWDVFKRIGADIQLKRMYFRYQIFVCLLKFDAFFFLGFSIQFLVLVSGTPSAEFAITVAAVPVILVCLILAAVAVRLESRTGVYIFFALDIAGLAYYLYKLVRIYDPTAGDRYATAKKTLTIFSIIAFLMLLVTFIMTGLCLINFDKGLKERIPPYYWAGGRQRKESGGEKLTSSGAGLDPTSSGTAGKVGGSAFSGGKGASHIVRQDTRMSLD